MTEQSTPDFDSIKQTNVYGVKYWSTRDLMPLLGYKRWDYFVKAVQDAINNLAHDESAANHISRLRNMVQLGSGKNAQKSSLFGELPLS